MFIGYARVSTVEQDAGFAAQLDCSASAPLRQIEGLTEGGFLVHRSRKERR
jgi:hypothetical protein